MIIKFYKNDCVPCEAVSKWLDARNVKHEPINAFDHPETAAKYRIRSLPTTLLIDDNNNVLVRAIGYNPTDLENILRYQNK